MFSGKQSLAKWLVLIILQLKSMRSLTLYCKTGKWTSSRWLRDTSWGLRFWAGWMRVKLEGNDCVYLAFFQYNKSMLVMDVLFFSSSSNSSFGINIFHFVYYILTNKFVLLCRTKLENHSHHLQFIKGT